MKMLLILINFSHHCSIIFFCLEKIDIMATTGSYIIIEGQCLWSLNISIQIALTVLHTFPIALTGKTCSIIQTFYTCWSFPFSHNLPVYYPLPSGLFWDNLHYTGWRTFARLITCTQINLNNIIDPPARWTILFRT